MSARATTLRAAAAMLVLVVVGQAAGCSSLLAPTQDKSRYFVLTPEAQAPASPTPLGRRLAIGLGPLQLPAYLINRDDVATLAGPNRVAYSSIDRWAEPLDENFDQVMARDLSTALGTNQISQFPWNLGTHLDYTVSATFDHFELDGTGVTLLAGQWQIRDGSGLRVLQSGDAHYSEAAGDDPAGALSRAVASLSGQIADAILALHAANASTTAAADSASTPPR
jgi:uncharacterized lipoprotein YmbA